VSADELEPTRWRARRSGFALLFASACTGFVLEGAHALKLSAYLDVPLRRELLTWAHAHGVGLALVLLAYATAGVVDRATAKVARTLTIGCVLLPLGFLLSALDVHESDPGTAIVLVPVGALCVLRALFSVLRAACRPRA
jgi:hypothetical protein